MDYVTFPFEKFVSCVITEYDVQADSILALYIEIAKYLRDNPIVSGLTVKEIIEKYLEENPPSAGVVSVNGRTGAVTGLYDAQNPPPYPVTSVNGKTGVVTGLYDAQNPPPYPVTSVNGKTGVVTGLYDAQNPPPYPVTSVNGKTGDVTIQEGGGGVAGVSSINGKTGAVTGVYTEEDPPPYPVTSVNGLTGDARGFSESTAFPIYAGQYMRDMLSKLGVTLSSNLPAGNVTYLRFRQSRPYATISSIFFSNRSIISVVATRVLENDVYVYVQNFSQEGTSVSMNELISSLGVINFGGVSYSLEYVNE